MTRLGQDSIEDPKALDQAQSSVQGVKLVPLETYLYSTNCIRPESKTIRINYNVTKKTDPSPTPAPASLEKEDASKTVTKMPALDNATAVDKPQSPPPTIATLKSLVDDSAMEKRRAPVDTHEITRCGIRLLS